jgi:hypothetical protein
MNYKKLSIIISAILFGEPANAALVSCGGPGDPCKLCDLFVIIDNIVDFILIDIVPPIAVTAFVIGGVYFFMSRGNPQSVSKAKSVLTAAVIGLLLVYGSFLIVSLFFNAIGVSQWTGLDGGWFNYPCY